MFFLFKLVRISPEIDWYHYKCDSTAIKIDKDSYELKITKYPCELSVPQCRLRVKRNHDDVPVSNDSKELEEEIVYETEVF